MDNKANTEANQQSEVTSKQNTTTNTKVVNTIPDTPRLTFPRVVTSEVWIRRKQLKGVLPGLDPDDVNLKIGSSYKGSSVNRGLTHEEEYRFLPEIIGLNKDSQNWETATSLFWKNITKPVPPRDGLRLDCSMRYDTEADYNHDLNAKKNENGIVINPKGKPVNVADYVLWRYCLVYKRVANDYSLINSAAHIDFYLHTKEKEIKDKKNLIAQKAKAFQVYSQNISDRNWADWLLRTLVAIDKNEKKPQIKDIVTMDEDEKDVLLDKYMTEIPDTFIQYGSDRHLEMRSFIEIAISMGILYRIPHTGTVTLDGVSIGNSADEVITYLTNPKNSAVYTAIKAQVNVKPS